MMLLLELPRRIKQLIAVLVDLALLPLTFCLAILLRYDTWDSSLFAQYVGLILAVPVVSIPIFAKFGLYRAVIRYIDQKTIGLAVLGIAISVLCLAALATFLQLSSVSRGVFGIYWVTAIVYVTISRVFARWLLRKANGTHGVSRVAIYGAGQAGRQLAHALRADHQYLPVAFIDDKEELQGTTISGVRVWSSEDLLKLVGCNEVSEIFLAMPSLTKAQQKIILDRLESLKVKIKVPPSIRSLVNGELRAQDIRDIEIEDLLGRDPVAPDPRLLTVCISGKTVLVTGAGGSIGSELCRQIIRLSPTRLILLEISEFALYSIEQELQSIRKTIGCDISVVPFLGSVLNYDKCKEIMATYRVDTVYHAAAYKHVPLVEHNPAEGIRNNAFGTMRMAQAAIAAGVSCFVLISTDKAVRPTNVMGTTKRLAELVLQAFSKIQKNTRFCMVRFGNVLGSSGSVVPLFRKQIMSGGPITLTHPDITRYFMTIPEAAQLVLQAGAMGQGGDVFVLDMGEPVRILDLATRMVHLSGLALKTEANQGDGIEVQYVGLRPGEKLYEELLIGTNVLATDHPLIKRAQEAEIPWQVLQGLFNRLEQACERFDYDEVRRLLTHIVAEYTPQCGIEDLIWHEKSKLKLKMMQGGEADYEESIPSLSIPVV